MKFKKTDKCDRVNATYLVMTSNFGNVISEENKRKIVGVTLSRLGCKGENEYGECVPDFLIFDPNFQSQSPSIEKEEDEGRSLHIGFPGLERKVYAKLDDYRSKETLSENVGHHVNTQFLTTIMLAEDY